MPRCDVLCWSSYPESPDALVLPQNERYAEANEIKREITLQLQPSQRAQREIERQQVTEMHRQLSTAVVRKNLFADVKRWGGTALASWRTISGGDLEFVPTPSKKKPPALNATPGQDPGPADVAGSAVQSPGGGRREGGGEGRTAPTTPKKEEVEVEEDEFSETMKMLYGALGAENPDLALAAECAVRLLEMVGDDDDDDEKGAEEDASITRLELAGACYDKVQQTVGLHLAQLAALGTCPLAAPSADAAAAPSHAARNSDKSGGPLSLEEALKRALGLWRVAGKVEAEAAAAQCVCSLVQQQIKDEADMRVSKIEAGMRLVESVSRWVT